MSDTTVPCNDAGHFQPTLENPSFFRYSIDVLSNGSEFSSSKTDCSSTAALFLSIWKTGNTSQGDTEDESQKLVARYGLDGVGSCDGLARIAADQQFKLGPVRALFLNHSTDSGRQHELISSIPSLLYANQQAAMSIVVPNSAIEDSLEKLVQLVHGYQTYPKVSTCAVPTVLSSSLPASFPQWWKVYEDDQIFVHAGRWDVAVDPEERIVYLFTFRCLLAANLSPDSTLLCPSLQAHQRTRSLSLTYWQLPMIDSAGIEPRLPRLGITWVLRPNNQGPIEDNGSGVPSVLPQKSAASTIFLLSPSEKIKSAIDPGLLVRAQQQTRDWQRHCDPVMLPFFPFHPTEVGTSGVDLIHRILPTNVMDEAKILMQTGTKIVIDLLRSDAQDDGNRKNPHSSRIVDCNQQRINRQSMLKKEASDSTDLSSNRYTWPSLLRNFLTPINTIAVDRDENEIDLDDFEGSNDPSKSPENGFDSVSPHLLVLGTGCASPSPYRGASGYALLLPNHSLNRLLETITIAVEVGEGYCTQWHRHASGRSFTSIRMIWISHAHWDHYGGLVNLILRIHQARHGTPNPDCATKECHSKKQKINSKISGNQETISLEDCPTVVAPLKVLKYLNLIFVKPGAYFRAVNLEGTAMMKSTLERLTIHSSSPIIQWRNVRVDHSCTAFGFVSVLKIGPGASPYVFGYSGDTRPCRDFVEQCRTVGKLYKVNGRVDFLIHEATFDDSESHMSLSKKHSTTKEAVMVGRDVDAERLLLTHFSQRYDTVPDIEAESARYSRRMAVGFALDGMKVPL